VPRGIENSQELAHAGGYITVDLALIGSREISRIGSGLEEIKKHTPPL
jgi:hypothetical protein